MPDRKLMKDISLNDPVTVTLPAHNWHGFMVAYSTTKWHSADADAILQKLIELLVDPVVLKEHEAAQQEQHDIQQGLFRLMTGGRPPGDLDDYDPRKETE